MARLYSDENFSLRVVERLRELGHDVLTVQETNLDGVSTQDQTILDVAVRLQLAVLTEDRRHFIRLHRLHPVHAGIIVCSTDNDVTAYADRIHAALLAEPELSGRLVRVNLPAT